MMGFLVSENVDYRKYPKLLFQFQPLFSEKKKTLLRRTIRSTGLKKEKKKKHYKLGIKPHLLFSFFGV